MIVPLLLDKIARTYLGIDYTFLFQICYANLLTSRRTIKHFTECSFAVKNCPLQEYYSLFSLFSVSYFIQSAQYWRYHLDISQCQNVRYFVQSAQFWRILQHLTSFTSVPRASLGRFLSIFFYTFGVQGIIYTENICSIALWAKQWK